MKRQEDKEKKDSGIRQPVIFVVGILLAICIVGTLSFKGGHTEDGSTGDVTTADGSVENGSTGNETGEGGSAENGNVESGTEADGSAESKTPDGVPGWDAEITEDNVLALLKAYDEDGYFLVEQAKERQDNFLSYYDSAFNFDGSPVRLLDALYTVVHEEFHMYSVSDEEVGAVQRRFYVGDGESVIVPLTEVFPTKEMADSVPENCRTTRFADYVSEPADGMESNVSGVYGLLNEFCAYRWELHNDIAMFDYCNKYGDGVNALDKYMNLCVSPREAYAEFKYYILQYLCYAKEHHPEICQGIMANDAFRSVYRVHEEGFRKNIEDFEKSLDQIQSTLESQGYTVKRVQDDFLIYDKDGNETGANLQSTDYNTLLQEMEKPEYVSMHNELVK